MKHEECACCKQWKVLMYGQRPDQTDGVLSITMGHDKTLHGTKDNPGGLVQEVQELKAGHAKHSRLVYLAQGFLLAVQIAWAIYLALKK